MVSAFLIPRSNTEAEKGSGVDVSHHTGYSEANKLTSRPQLSNSISSRSAPFLPELFQPSSPQILWTHLLSLRG